MITIEHPGDVRAGKFLGAGEIVITHEMLERYDVAVGGRHAAVEAEWAPTEATPSASPGVLGAACPVAILALQPFRFTGYRLADRQGAMNARVAWEFGRPLHLGETIRLSASVIERAIKGWRERVTFEMTGVDGGGAVVLRARPTVSYPVPGAARPPQPAGATAAALLLGADELPLYTRTLTVEMSRAIFFDVENYHTDTASARALGFSDVVIGGPHLLSLVSESLTGSLGRHWTYGGRINLAFVRPVVVGDTVTVRAALLPGGAAAAAAEQPLRVWIENQRGETVTVGDGAVRAAIRAG